MTEILMEIDGQEVAVPEIAERKINALQRENAELRRVCKRALDEDWCSPATCIKGGCLCNSMADAIGCWK